MNENRITNIIDRGGVEGWETVINPIFNIHLGTRLGIFEEVI